MIFLNLRKMYFSQTVFAMKVVRCLLENQKELNVNDVPHSGYQLIMRTLRENNYNHEKTLRCIIEKHENNETFFVLLDKCYKKAYKSCKNSGPLDHFVCGLNGCYNPEWNLR